jgi:ribonuclease R
MEAHELLEHIGRQPRGRTDFKHLARQLGARGKKRAALQQTLDRLAGDGRLIEFRSGHYSLPQKDSEFITGRLSLHAKGFGFVIPDRPPPGVEGDIFIPHRGINNAMHDDRVMVRLMHIKDDRRAEGRIERIIKRTNQFVVAVFHYSRHGSFASPHDDRIREDIAIPRGSELPSGDESEERLGDLKTLEVKSAEELDGLIVNVEIVRFPTRLETGEGRVVEILGRPDDFGVDVEIMIRRFHLPHRFSAEVQAEVEAIPAKIPAGEIEGRRDFREFDIVTIDGETARDFDDAVRVERLEKGCFALHVHIADVSHYVRMGSALDVSARERGTSVYFPDRAVPMLPSELSTGICSLNPKQDRLVMSALLKIDSNGAIVEAEFCRGVIRSVERMTYTNVFGVLEGDAALRKRYAPLVERFELMQELATILNRRRRKRGSIDFDVPEAEIQFDDFGRMTGVIRSERNAAHRIIEEFMLAANEAVARWLASVDGPALYRIHEKPEAKRVLEFEQLAHSFGHTLGIDVPVRKFGRTQRRRDGSKSRHTNLVADTEIDISPRNYQRLIKQIEGTPEERILSYLMLRSLKQARYSEKNQGHFALATKLYTHFTSPIRRYPDLVVHRILNALLDQDPGSPYTQREGETPYAESDVEAIAQETSFTERRAADAERALIQWKKARFMEERLGDEFDALVIQVTKTGLFVELLDLFVEGLVPIESLPGRFQYLESTRALINQRTKLKLALGDRIRVRAAGIRFDGMRAEFSWVQPDKGNKRS